LSEEAGEKNDVYRGLENMKSATENGGRTRNVAEMLKDWLLPLVMVVFIFLYAAAFALKFDPLRDNTFLLRLEPIILILIGFYFGRLPASQNERALKQEITRQFHTSEAANFAKVSAEIERETLEEKIKNARTVLRQCVSNDKNKSEQADLGLIKAVDSILNS
jgi:hypothetical protein